MDWDVKVVKPLADYQIYVELENGQQGTFDLKPYLNQGVFRALQDVNYFNQVDIAFGAVTWPNEQDIAPDTLLAGLVPVAQDLAPRARDKSCLERCYADKEAIDEERSDQRAADNPGSQLSRSARNPSQN